MLTMFCSQSEMHSRLAAVVGINFQENPKEHDNPKFYLVQTVPGQIETATQAETIMTMLLIGSEQHVLQPS